MKHLFICAQHRSGTNFLGELLTCGPAHTAFANLSESLMNHRSLERDPFFQTLPGENINSILATRFIITDPLTSVSLLPGECPHANPDFNAERLCQVLQAHYTETSCKNNGYVLVKWFPYGLHALLHQLHRQWGTDASECIRRCFGEVAYVRLVRQNLHRQAISLYLAVYINRWMRLKQPQSGITPTAPPENPKFQTLLKRLKRGWPFRKKRKPVIDYNFREIKKYYDFLQAGERWWDAFFRDNAIEPALTFSYEELVANYPDILNNLSRVLGIRLHIPHPDEIQHQQVATGLNEEFYQRFIRDMETATLLPDQT